MTGAPQPGGQKLPNPFGLFDLHGNVREWCYDWYSSEYYASSPAVDPVGPDAGSDRVMRGGRIGRKAIECRSAFRYDIAPFLRNTDGGFRVVRSLPPTVTDLVLAPGTVWSAPEVAGPELNSSREDASPFVSEDGLLLLFASKRPLGHVGYEIWESRRSSLSEPFGQPKELPRIVNSIGDDDSPWLTADGCELFFASNRPGSNGQRDLYVCRRTTPAAKWEAPVNLGEAINTTDNEDCPVLADNGLTLYFASNRPGGQGGMDVYRARRPAMNAPFEAPMNLGTVVNSSQDDLNFAPLRDGRSALLARQNANQSTVMVVRMDPQDGGFGQLQPVELGQLKGTIKAPRLSHDGSTLYFHASLPQGAGAFDLWKVHRVQNSSPADDAARPPATSSLQFDGSGARVEIPSLVMEPTKPITIEVWARPSKPVNHGVVAGFAGQCVLRLRSKQWWFGVRDKDSKIHEVVASSDVDWNKTAHVAGVYDGKHVRLFVDGIRHGEPVPCSSVVAVNWMATLGAAFDGTDPFAGEVSQARFSQVARYVDDFDPPARFTSDKDTLAMYLFQEVSGTSLKDESGHIHSGKIVNATWISNGTDKKLSAQTTSSRANPDRVAAEWVIAQGGEVALIGRQGMIASVNDLPADNFEIRHIKFKRRLTGADADLVPLRALNHLEFVGIDYSHPTPAGITALARLPKLERVSCGGQPLSDDQVTALTRLNKITSLYLAGAQLKPAQCAILAGAMAQVGSLNLMNNPLLDDTALTPLARMSKLAKLQLQGTKVTAAGVAALQTSLPNCSIEWDDPNRSK